METIHQSIERFSLPPFTEYRESENLYDSDTDRDDTARHNGLADPMSEQMLHLTVLPSGKTHQLAFMNYYIYNLTPFI
jgi:hypothetical protein